MTKPSVKHHSRTARRTISQRAELIGAFHSWGLNPDTREIVLMSDPHGAEEEINWVCANTFLKNLLLLNSMNHFPILVHQCTGGGDWGYGMAIYDAIKASPSPVILIAHAYASSMSSIIPQAAKRRVIMPNADFMVHFGSAGFEGDSRSFITEGKQAEAIDNQMLDIYAARCVRGNFFRRNKYSRDKTREYIRQKMNEVREWHMTAGEAVDRGFMDGVFGTPRFKTYDEIRDI